jgi:pimeloyl-ACP methyl ester carboxylesterase
VVVVAGSVSPDLEKTKWFQIPGQWWPIRNLIPNMLRVCNEEILPLKGELNQMLPDWPNIKAKMALVQGEEDDLVPPGNLDFMLKKLNSESVVKVVRAPHVNHFIPWQHPEFILESIRAVNQAIN